MFLFIRGLHFNVTDVDMLENVELGEQKQRDDAYKAAKKKTGIYADKYVGRILQFLHKYADGNLFTV